MLGGKWAFLGVGGGGAYTRSNICVREERWAYKRRNTVSYDFCAIPD